MLPCVCKKAHPTSKMFIFKISFMFDLCVSLQMITVVSPFPLVNDEGSGDGKHLMKPGKLWRTFVFTKAIKLRQKWPPWIFLIVLGAVKGEHGLKEMLSCRITEVRTCLARMLRDHLTDVLFLQKRAEAWRIQVSDSQP